MSGYPIRTGPALERCEWAILNFVSSPHSKERLLAFIVHITQWRQNFARPRPFSSKFVTIVVNLQHGVERGLKISCFQLDPQAWTWSSVNHCNSWCSHVIEGSTFIHQNTLLPWTVHERSEGWRLEKTGTSTEMNRIWSALPGLPVFGLSTTKSRRIQQWMILWQAWQIFWKKKNV